MSTTPFTSIELHHGWTVSAIAGPVPADVAGRTITATVPGAVHTDLLAAGLIPDPYLDDNERLLAWIGLVDWTYRTSFQAPASADRHELVFEGVDTVATISLNGTVLGEVRNMHRSYRFDVTALLADENELVVAFRSPIKAADAASLELGYRPHVNHHPYNALRKMACSFGWDWGIDTSTSGLWKPVRLESWSLARLTTVRPAATVDGTDGVIEIAVDVARTAEAPLAITAKVGDHTVTVDVPAGGDRASITLRLPDVDLWWPRGYGGQPLYDLSVELTADGAVVDARSHRLGFRTVVLDMAPDDAGTPFTIVVNDQPILIRGANWIPDDAFPHRVDRDRYRRRIEQAEFARMNLLRVWGGGIYESDDFYELCDERGMLTWQDFLLACAAYAEEAPLSDEIEAEAREAVTRIGSHASLVLFNGNNENVWGYEEWNWPLRLEGRTWGSGYYYELFPAIVAELAPAVGYTPASPFSPEAGLLQNDMEHGTMHLWETWNRLDYPHYRDYTPRFVAEFGWQGPPTWSTLVSSISDEPLTPESPGMLVHQKAMEGNTKLTDGLIPHLSLPNEIGDWHWAMSLNQAVAIRTAVEYFRSLRPHCMGTVVWQLNDCWPVTSWAAVDGYERPKPLLYALRHAHADRLVTIQPQVNGLAAVVVNDTGTEFAGDLVLARHDFTGRALTSVTVPVQIPAHSSTSIPLPVSVAGADDAARELIRAELDGVVGHWFFAEYRDSELGAQDVEAVAEVVDGGYRVSVMARTLVRDVTILADKVAPASLVSDALITLLPGERHVFEIATASVVAPAAFVDPSVLRTANQLVTR